MTVEGARLAKDRTEARTASIARNRAFVDALNARTFCAHCGAQPIEWHNPEHVELNRRQFRIGEMVNKGRDLSLIQEEITRCTPLCRRCHMTEDGRMGRFVEQARAQDKTKPPRPCSECHRLTTRFKRGRCNSCAVRLKYQSMSPEEKDAFRAKRRDWYYTKTATGENQGAAIRRKMRIRKVTGAA